MKTIKGPGLFLAQFMGDEPPFDTLESIAQWAAELGFVDEVIYPRELRKRLATSLEMLAHKRAENPPKKHGNIPL